MHAHEARIGELLEDITADIASFWLRHRDTEAKGLVVASLGSPRSPAGLGLDVDGVPAPLTRHQEIALAPLRERSAQRLSAIRTRLERIAPSLKRRELAPRMHFFSDGHDRLEIVLKLGDTDIYSEGRHAPLGPKEAAACLLHAAKDLSLLRDGPLRHFRIEDADISAATPECALRIFDAANRYGFFQGRNTDLLTSLTMSEYFSAADLVGSPET